MSKSSASRIVLASLVAAACLLSSIDSYSTTVLSKRSATSTSSSQQPSTTMLPWTRMSVSSAVRTRRYHSGSSNLMRLELAKKAGTFFNPVPEDAGDDDNSSSAENRIQEEQPKQPRSPQTESTGDSSSSNKNGNNNDPFENDLTEILRRRRSPSRASEPSTINGVPTAIAHKAGFGKDAATMGKRRASSSSTARSSKGGGVVDGTTTSGSDKPFVGIGPPDKKPNDITNPEYDDQGYTLYQDEKTGEKSRVFEALIDYPCDFTMKIVGANEGSFVAEMVAVVAESCQVEASTIQHSVRLNGKWTSLTVQAPVQSAEMLYALYENVDRDPRVKFKF